MKELFPTVAVAQRDIGKDVLDLVKGKERTGQFRFIPTAAQVDGKSPVFQQLLDWEQRET
jgi:hypothetical protein